MFLWLRAESKQVLQSTARDTQDLTEATPNAVSLAMRWERRLLVWSGNTRDYSWRSGFLRWDQEMTSYQEKERRFWKEMGETNFELLWLQKGFPRSWEHYFSPLREPQGDWHFHCLEQEGHISSNIKSFFVMVLQAEVLMQTISVQSLTQACSICECHPNLTESVCFIT